MRKNQTTYIVAGLIGVVLILLWMGRQGTDIGPAQTVGDPNALAGMQIGKEPWPPELSKLSDRLRAMGLPTLVEEGMALHIHQHIDIFVRGNKIYVPPGIGINQSAGFISSIHTHDGLGVIHVESPTVQTFTLGQFFDIWGVRFDGTCLGAYCTEADPKLQVFINGKEVSGDSRTIALESHQEIAVTFGTSAELPSPMPDSYTFSASE